MKYLILNYIKANDKYKTGNNTQDLFINQIPHEEVPFE